MQPAYVFPLTSSEGDTLFIYVGDRWNFYGPGSVSEPLAHPLLQYPINCANPPPPPPPLDNTAKPYIAMTKKWRSQYAPCWPACRQMWPPQRFHSMDALDKAALFELLQSMRPAQRRFDVKSGPLKL